VQLLSPGCASGTGGRVDWSHATKAYDFTQFILNHGQSSPLPNPGPVTGFDRAADIIQPGRLSITAQTLRIGALAQAVAGIVA